MNENNNNNNNNIPSQPSKKIKKKGSKEEVFNGNAIETAGGLRKDDLIENKKGKIVSKKKSEYGQIAIKNIHNKIKANADHSSEDDSDDDDIKEETPAPEEIKSPIPTGPILGVNDKPLVPGNPEGFKAEPVEQKINIPVENKPFKRQRKS